ncbi:MAG: beta-galactosidase [Clostridiales bacterium]|nr:beta-galactosidase [Clostridiales bacterium]
MYYLNEIGSINCMDSFHTSGNRFGIGLEKLDRSMYDPSDAYDRLKNTGVKLVRIQSGWAKTEKKEGIYDFAWLDDVVDNLTRRGMEPWICLCYGNPVYTSDAKDEFGCVNYPPVKTEREMNAWLEYCLKVVRRYIGKVSKYEIWNEPEWLWKYGNDPVQYGTFAVRTAKAIKEIYPNTYIISGALTNLDPSWADRMLSVGLDRYTDAVSYHRYSTKVETLLDEIPKFKAMLLNHGIKDLINGESGCQSAPFGAGALAGGRFSEDIQTKIILRRSLIDLMTEVRFSSVFTAVDVEEALVGVTGAAYFGVMSNVHDDNGEITGRYREKPSYYALRNFISVFDGDISLCDADLSFTPSRSDHLFCEDDDGNGLISQGFAKGTARAFAYYRPTEVMTTSYSSTISFEIGGFEGKPELIDLYDGRKYDLEDACLVSDGKYRFSHIPVKDYPLVITFGGFIN